MNYRFIIDEFVWSYSRLRTFEDCPYAFFMRYIVGEYGKSNFFSEFGTFIHEIIAEFLSGDLDGVGCINKYVTEYSQSVVSQPPSQGMTTKYYTTGLKYIANMKLPNEEILGVEMKYDFDIGGVPFRGIVDMVSRDKDGRLIITDHKSKILRPRSGRRVATSYDVELDTYLKQPYIYSIPIKREFGCYPDSLRFNCFRGRELVTEPFDISKLEASVEWATKLIEKIKAEDVWNANVDWFRCRNICDMGEICEYAAMEEI